jgi:hypothetical protein
MLDHEKMPKLVNCYGRPKECPTEEEKWKHLTSMTDSTFKKRVLRWEKCELMWHAIHKTEYEM